MVDFSGSLPNGSLNSEVYSNEQCATVSSETSGDILFYTDGQTVWDSNNQPMPNGSNLFGGAYLSCTQGPVIVPFPHDVNRYYIFTLDDLEYDIPQLDNGLRYSIVDMTLNNGFGDVDPMTKNVYLTNFLTEKITVVRSEAIKGYWVIVHKRESNQFLSYKVTDCGVDSVPVISNIGTPLLSANSPSDPRMPFYGSMKGNFAGTRIAMPIDASKLIEFYSFNSATGQLYSALTIEVNDNTTSLPIRKYGCSFSPDDSKFYYTNTISVYQLNLSVYDSLSVAISNILINTPASPTFQIEQASNGKLYVAVGGSMVLDEIDSPNNPGTTCNYINNAVQLNGMALLGLPAYVHERNFLTDQILSQPDTCLESLISFQLQNTTPVVQVNWNFDDPLSGVNNISSLLNPVHQFTAPGNYIITAIVEYECYIDTVKKNIFIYDCPQPLDSLPFLEFPNVISANNDGLNDEFEILDLPVNTELVIYNRWGKKVFKSENYQNNWDGKDISGNELVEGVYFYTYYISENLKGQGFIHLIR